MDIEYEATFPEVDKEDMRKRLRQVGAELVRPEFVQRRFPFCLPGKDSMNESWLRVRDEGDRVTLSLKSINGERIENQREICLSVSSFDEAGELLELIGCTKRCYQETKRELWRMEGVDITLDEWPFLEPFVEVEGKDEESVRRISEKLGFDYSVALFCTVGKLYRMKYNQHPDEIPGLEKLVFDMPNPFV